ncbi:keratin-associated protein 5-3-like [Dendronephthya gigantea]|uniref:keratin-associated protein 5-3-like n=1 Tax=Dendronephthya gigantea TaxID=151771 RepID=UPI001069A769|nr:keratin-associated protein 5-3-like [Dendronephthya gigantea]
MTLLFLLNAILMGKFGLVSGQSTCTSNSDCVSSYYSNKVCCKGYAYKGYGYTSRKCYYGSSLCVGRYCTTDGDCGGKNECCKSNKCTTSGCSNCYSNSNCGFSEYCCKQRYSYDKHVCRRSCVGETCNSSSDCGGSSEYCDFNKKCVECSTDGDCIGSECCLYNKCVTSGCTPCFSNFGCSSSEYCCRRGVFYSNVCRKNCVGEKCSYDSDCRGPGESCDSSSKKCALPTSCFTDGDCSGSECCLNYKCVTSGCTPCSSNSGCSSSEYCCKRGDYVNVCRKNCVGETCSYDSDCGGPRESCRSNKCKKSSTTTASWVVPVIVVGVILFFAVFGGIPAYRCFRGSSQRGRVVRQRAPQNAIAIVAVEKTQSHTSAPPPPPVCNAPPPPYYNQGGDFPSPQPNQFSRPQSPQY